VELTLITDTPKKWMMPTKLLWTETSPRKPPDKQPSPIKQVSMNGERETPTIITEAQLLLFKRVPQTVEMIQLMDIPSKPIMDTTLFWKQLLIWKPQELLPLPVQKLAMSGEKVTHTITLKEKEKLQTAEMIQPTDIPSMPIMVTMLFWLELPI
jgi:hypothetical protein